MIEPRPAATVAVVRDTPAGLEVLLLQRTHQAVFMPGVYVFPGGAVDVADGDGERWAGHTDVDDATASRRLGVAAGGLGYLVAAVRECFEEAGLLLADRHDGEPVARHQAVDMAGLRRALCAGEADFSEMCRSHGLRLHTGRMGYLAHWVTPPGPPRRYDTRFFVAEAPSEQAASHDGEETVDHVWITPAQALQLNREGRFPLGSPTIRTLRTLAEFSDVEAALAHGRRAHAVPPPRPVTAAGRDGPRLIHPGDPAYAEAAKVTAERVDTARYELLPGTVQRLSRQISRVVAPNPGVMTGPGTNTYLIDAGDGVAVIDPGPDVADHVDSIERAGGRIRWILTTHTHRDHSPASRSLKARTGATVIGLPAPPGPGQDSAHAPEHLPADGERLVLDGCTTLRAIHTPGHASNHLCYLLEEARVLFSGDHVMQGSTVVINPPDGDMSAYLQSLERLHHEDIEYIAPGHGFLIGDPHRAVDRIISHRMAREAKVMDCLRQRGPALLSTLLGCVYADVPEGMHGVAARSLLAHLLKLQDDGLAELSGEEWQATGDGF